MKRWNRVGALGAFVGMMAACGGFGAGDIEVYRVTFDRGSSSGDCDDDVEFDTNTFKTSAVWVLMATDVGGEVE